MSKTITPKPIYEYMMWTDFRALVAESGYGFIGSLEKINELKESGQLKIELRTFVFDDGEAEMEAFVNGTKTVDEVLTDLLNSKKKIRKSLMRKYLIQRNQANSILALLGEPQSNE